METTKIKHYFNTGVKPWNHTDKKGKLIVRENEEFINNELHLVYYLEREPTNKERYKYLVQADYIDKYLKDYEVAIKIISGSVGSDYAIFTKLE